MDQSGIEAKFPSSRRAGFVIDSGIVWFQLAITAMTIQDFVIIINIINALIRFYVYDYLEIVYKQSALLLEETKFIWGIFQFP